MEGVVNPRPNFWNGRRVFLTGHTGFKGSWLALWLARMGAEVHGYALNPLTAPSLYETAAISTWILQDHRADLANRETLSQALQEARPSIVFHLAAQPFVRQSYADPIGTFATNVMGTANLLEEVREIECIDAIVIVTTDKVYLNCETSEPFVEDDPISGEADPYSASKAASEIVAQSWRKSFFEEKCIPLATVRAGNVLGGGDWSRDRLVPDCLRSFAVGEKVQLRYPNAVRPWQHVVEPLAGYIILAEQLAGPKGMALARAWNFGPGSADEATVGEVATLTAEIWGGNAQVQLPEAHEKYPREAGYLRLDSSAVKHATGWAPRWNLRSALERTVSWHRAWLDGDDMTEATLSDIANWSASIST